MSLTTGQQALVRRIMTMPDRPNVVWPGGGDKPLPRYVIQNAAGAQSRFGIDGTTESYPEINVRVETDSNNPDASANDALVAKLDARFRPGDTFDGVEIVDATWPRQPLLSTGVYAVPVIIRCRYIF